MSPSTRGSTPTLAHELPSSPLCVPLEACGVAFSYVPGQRVLEGVDLSVTAGEIIGLIGPNGAGKSTLLRLLVGGLRPTSGEIRLDSRDLASWSRADIAQRVAFVPQKTFLPFPFTVFEVVLMGRQPYAGLAVFESDQDVAVARTSLERVGVSHLSEKYFHQLSGGEQQLVVLARALAQETAILVLDEPVSFLDLRHQWEILSLLRELAANGKAVLATFHDLNAAGRWCDQLALLAGGRLIAFGRPTEVLREELLRQAYRVDLRISVDSRGFPRVDLP